MKRELELYKQKIGSTGNTGNTGNMGITSNIDNTNISTSTKQPDIPTSKLTCLKLI